MQYPLQIGTGNMTISSHTVFETAGMMIGFRYFLYLRRNRTDKISDQNRIWLFIATTFGAFLFSRLASTLEHPFSFVHSPHSLVSLFANKTIIGALLGGLLTTEIAKKILGIQHSSGDMMTIPLILGIMIGRIGCFTTGIYEETYGLPTNFFLGMDLGDGIKRHPTSLYEIAFLALLWIVLTILQKKYTIADGWFFKLFMISYLTFRLITEFIKPRTVIVAGLGGLQLFCIAGLLYYAGSVWQLLFKPQRIFGNGKQELHLLRPHNKPVQ